MSITQLDRDEIFLMFALTESARALDHLRELRRLCTVREKRGPGLEVRELGTVFDEIRLMLHFAGSISRVFWSPGRDQRAQDRSLRLRDSIGLTSDHPLSRRGLRNHIEHLDERLDEWTATSPRPFTTIEMVLYDDTHERTREQAMASVAFIYDQTADKVIIFGEQYDLADIEADLMEVQSLISAAAVRRVDSWAVI